MKIQIEAESLQEVESGAVEHRNIVQDMIHRRGYGFSWHLDGLVEGFRPTLRFSQNSYFGLSRPSGSFDLHRFISSTLVFF